MPSDALTVAVTTGLGVSVLAGILSGICYILTYGLPQTRARKPITPWHCNVCGGQFRSIQGILEVEKVVTCAKCKAKVCRVRCSKRHPQRGWICQICQQPENWFKGLWKSIHPNNDWNNTMDPDELDEDLMELKKKEREQVRDFIERLVESMLGGSLDDVTVSHLYNDKKYDSLFGRYHTDLSNALTDLGSALHISISNLPITGQSPCSAHAYLKQLIERFTHEAVDLPTLCRNESHPAHPEETIDNRTYEDLLSAAIINKVVQANQNEPRSSTNSSRTSKTTRKSGNKEYFFGEETLEKKWENHSSMHDDASSVSSVDEWIRSDSSIGSSKYVDRMSLTIKQHIEEGSSSDDEAVDNETHVQENSFLHSEDENWHENWYFQKRTLTNSSSPVPVPMLVPNPITEAKVLIGDKEAEEFSDRDSDYGDPEVVPDIKNILVNSKTIIGGKNPTLSIDETDNLFHSTDILPAENDDLDRSNETNHTFSEDSLQPDEQIIPKQFNTTDYPLQSKSFQETNGDVLNTPESYNEDISLISIGSNTEQDTEYTEQFASLTFLKVSTPVPRAQAIENLTENTTELSENRYGNVEHENPNSRPKNYLNHIAEERGTFIGTYSERETEKWKHSTIDIPDNPYSPENLERRLNRSLNSSSSSLFGRDYYIKNAAKSAGARSPSKILAETEVIEFSPTSNGSDINSEDIVTVVTAVPALIHPDESNELESLGESLMLQTKPIVAHDISSDSDLSIERIYNLQSGKVFEKKGNVRHEIFVEDPCSPEGLKYIPKEFDEDNGLRDENYNNTGIRSSKQAFMRSLTQNDDKAFETVKNDLEHIEETLPRSEEESVKMPYDECKFKETLDMFNIVPQTNVTSKQKSEKLIVEDNVATSETIKIHTADVVENDNSKTQAVNGVSYETLHSFGEPKRVVDNKINTSDCSEMLSDTRDFSLEYSTDLNDDEVSRIENCLETDPEIIGLKEKRIVKDLLGKFSKSYPNISIPLKQTDHYADGIKDEDTENTVAENPLDGEVDVIPCVKNLKQLFDKENTNSQIKKDPKQIYSLTARSLSMQFRQKLKSDDEASLPSEENAVNGKTEEEVEEILPVDITKSRIAFFEDLRNK
ncbi:hypothetical protein Trydic_g8400 [Trypoxylus dichotomus]